MRALAAYVFWVAFWWTGPGSLTGQDSSQPSSLDTGETYFSIHSLDAAHKITLGAGAKVGILDHSFEFDSHPELYAGGHVFSTLHPSERGERKSHRGYWMALALREVAPGAKIYPLVLPSSDGEPLVEAIVQALDWAVEHDLDAVTYCGGDFSRTEREKLDLALERTVRAGVVVVFVGYPHPLNLLPGGFGEADVGGGRPPDLNIFSHDCIGVLADQVVALLESDDDAIQRRRPFLGRPNGGPVTAGLVALLRSVDQQATPGEIKRVLMETSRPMEYGGLTAPRVPDAFRALRSVSGLGPA